MWIGNVELLHNRKGKQECTVLSCMWAHSLQGAISTLVSAQLEFCVQFAVLLLKIMLTTLNEKRAGKVTREP